MERDNTLLVGEADARSASLDDCAADRLEQGLDACPFQCSGCWLREYRFEGFTVPGIHKYMLAYSAIVR